ncbi:MAG: inorganic diphosphatase [Candidatus Pacebacteria bacterium]|nr:inorganic diphosphatase [Candidatus Paceibacterota bacterium]
MNLLHDIESGSAEKMNVIIEIPKGSKNKYEIDKETGIIALDRVLHSAQDYPFDYGFVPQTLWDDGDALDVVVLTTYPLMPGILVRVRPVAILPMVDGGESDAKVLAVPTDDPRFADIKDLSDVNKHTLKEIAHFFLTYKQIQNKEVSLGEWGGRADAEAAFTRSRELYTNKGA